MCFVRQERSIFRSLKAIFILIAVIASFGVSAQQPDVEEIIEAITSAQEGNPDFSELQEHFDRLKDHPVNINTAGAEELSQLLLLTDFQIHSLLDYRKTTGPLRSIYELLLVYGFDRQTIENIAPFITFNTKRPGKRFTIPRYEVITGVSRRMETAVGFVADTNNQVPAYPGDRYNIVTRFHGNIGPHFEAGIVAQQDPGEVFRITNRQAGFDYLTGYLEYKNNNAPLKQIIAGSYHLRFGQGLVVWSGFSMNKTPEVLQVSKRTSGITPYRSSDENGGFRGIALNIKTGDFTFTPFFSSRLKDARLSFDTINGSMECGILSLPSTGLHRTDHEQMSRDAVRETATGFYTGWTHHSWKTGMSFFYSRFNKAFCQNDALYNIFPDVERSNMNLSLDYVWRGKKLVLSGEGAMGKNGALAGIQNVQWYFFPVFSFAAVSRWYDPAYPAYYANSFSESGHTRNESGIYSGFRFRPFKFVAIAAYTDFFHFPWLTYASETPSSGNEYLVTADFIPDDRFRIHVRLQETNKEKSFLPEGSLLKAEATEKRTHVRIQGNYTPLSSLMFTTRLDFTAYRFPEKDSDGFLSYQQIRYSPPSLPLVVYFRYTLFGTTGYGARIYTYENDLRYNFSTPVFNGKGTRMFLLIRYTGHNRTTVGLKISRTDYSDRESTGQGYDLIPFSHSTDLKIQLRILL